MSFGAFDVQRYLIGDSIRNPRAQALIVGPVAEPPRILRLAPLEAHFFLLDKGDQ